jgi:hypothetical protein
MKKQTVSSWGQCRVPTGVDGYVVCIRCDGPTTMFSVEKDGQALPTSSWYWYQEPLRSDVTHHFAYFSDTRELSDLLLCVDPFIESLRLQEVLEAASKEVNNEERSDSDSDVGD